jgi:hypothetical protein
MLLNASSMISQRINWLSRETITSPLFFTPLPTESPPYHGYKFFGPGSNFYSSRHGPPSFPRRSFTFFRPRSGSLDVEAVARLPHRRPAPATLLQPHPPAVQVEYGSGSDDDRLYTGWLDCSVFILYVYILRSETCLVLSIRMVQKSY